MKEAFMITIVGYSGPKTDQEAISLMKTASGDIKSRSLEQTCFITIDSEEKTAENGVNLYIHIITKFRNPFMIHGYLNTQEEPERHIGVNIWMLILLKIIQYHKI